MEGIQLIFFLIQWILRQGVMHTESPGECDKLILNELRAGRVSHFSVMSALITQRRQFCVSVKCVELGFYPLLLWRWWWVLWDQRKVKKGKTKEQKTLATRKFTLQYVAAYPLLFLFERRWSPSTYASISGTLKGILKDYDKRIRPRFGGESNSTLICHILKRQDLKTEMLT